MWEYVKGSEADFEGAPDWATLATADLGGPKDEVAYFVEKHEVGARYRNNDSSWEDTISEFTDFKSIRVIAERRWVETVLPDNRTVAPVHRVEMGFDDGNDPAKALTYSKQGMKFVEDPDGDWVKVNKFDYQQIFCLDCTETLITERGSRYGEFKDGAAIMQQLKDVMHSAPKWDALKPSQKEGLEMIQHKIGRILNGDPNYDDNWKDIAGYATLIAKEIEG